MPGAAREREHREDEPNERGVDGEPDCQPAADAGDDAVATAAFEEQRRHRAHRSALTMSIRPAPTFASITSSPPVPPLTSMLRPPSCWLRT